MVVPNHLKKLPAMVAARRSLAQSYRQIRSVSPEEARRRWRLTKERGVAPKRVDSPLHRFGRDWVERLGR